MAKRATRSKKTTQNSSGKAKKSADATAESPIASATKHGIRNRNLGTRRVKAGDLLSHPKNWREHPTEQHGALRDILKSVGFVGTLIARETDDGLQLIDGHLRADTMADEEVDVMVVDLNDDEVDLILATHDTVGEMAEGNAEALDDLIAKLDISSGEVASMLSDLMDDLGGAPATVRDGNADPASAAKGPRFPLTPVLNEKYEYAVIFCRDETEWGALQTLLKLQRERSYKSSGIAIGHVVPFEKFFDLWEKRDELQDSLPNA